MSPEPILDQPRSGVICRLCGKHLGLYVVRGKSHGLCAPCTKARIETYAPQPDQRSSWVAMLYDEVLREIRYEEYQEKQQLTLDWDLVKCSVCGKMMKLRDARYPGQQGSERVQLDSDESEEPPERIVAQARRLRDGTLLIFPSSGAPQIHHPVCQACNDEHRTRDPNP